MITCALSLRQSKNRKPLADNSQQRHKNAHRLLENTHMETDPTDILFHMQELTVHLY